MEQAINSNQTVQDVKEEMDEWQIDVENLNNFADIPEANLSRMFGESMVQSVNGYFVTADTCLAFNRTICDETPIRADSAGNCGYNLELHIDDLFTLKGTGPFDLKAFGLPSGFEKLHNIDCGEILQKWRIS